jgi:hypothetical protein
VSETEAEAWDRLLFHLENQTGFWFAMVVGDDPGARGRLYAKAKPDGGGTGDAPVHTSMTALSGRASLVPSTRLVQIAAPLAPSPLRVRAKERGV